MQGEPFNDLRERVVGFVGDHMLVVTLRRGPKVAKLDVSCVDCGADIWSGVVNYDVSPDMVLRSSLEHVERHLAECEAPVDTGFDYRKV